MPDVYTSDPADDWLAQLDALGAHPSVEEMDEMLRRAPPNADSGEFRFLLEQLLKARLQSQ